MTEPESPTRLAIEPKSEVSFDPKEFQGAMRDAFSGITTIVLGVLLVVAILIAATGLLAGVGLGGRYLYLAPWASIPAKVVGVVVLLGLTYVAWIVSLYVSVTSLDALGLHLRGKSIYYCLPLAPAIAVVCGPIAGLASIGDRGKWKNFSALFGLGVLVLLGVLIWRLTH